MENFDIEKLERKTPYALPENTFGEIQRNVLEKIEIKKEAPIFNLKWFYSAAAIILLIVGVNFIVKYNESNTQQSPKIAVKEEAVSQEINSAKTLADTTEIPTFANANKPSSETMQNLKLTTASSNSHEISDHKAAINTDLASAKVISAKLRTKNNLPTEEQIDEVLNGFSSSEIASLSNNSAQDVYLDLYN